MSQPSVAIAVNDVSMIYRAHGAEIHALSHVSLDVTDLYQPTGGSILVKGTSAREARLSRQYGMVFQQPVLLDWRTVMKNIMLPLEVMGYPKAEQQERTERLLKRVGLTKFAGKYPWLLSGGMQQRVAIASRRPPPPGSPWSPSRPPRASGRRLLLAASGPTCWPPPATTA